MKTLIIAITIILSNTIYAQGQNELGNLFVRVYNLEGQKINKGKVIAVKDTLLQINGKKGRVDIEVSSIGLIKTKRSAGHNILIGTAISAFSGAIIGAISAEPDALFVYAYSAGEGAAGGAVLGLPIGVVLGGITALFKNSKSYIIDGDLLKWVVFQEMIMERNN